MALGQAVYTGERKIVYSELPDFTAFYIDDIDSLGHNNAYGPYPKRATFEERQRDIEERLEVIQQELEDFVDICKQRGLFQNMAILITTDHGMTPFTEKQLARFTGTLERSRNQGNSSRNAHHRYPSDCAAIYD